MAPVLLREAGGTPAVQQAGGLRYGGEVEASSRLGDKAVSSLRTPKEGRASLLRLPMKLHGNHLAAWFLMRQRL